MYARMDASKYIYIYVQIHASIQTYIHKCTYMNMYNCKCTYTDLAYAP